MLRRSVHPLTLTLMALCALALILTALQMTLPAVAQAPSPTPDMAVLCDTVLTRAVTLTEAECTRTGRNEACYGYTQVHADFQPDVDARSISFDRSGDILPVRQLASLRTEALDLLNGTWGMAVMKLQATLPDTNPGQNVTFILFGDSVLENDISRTNAFYLSTALGELSCRQIPENSLMVRAPGHLSVSFSINEVQIRLASAAVLRAQPGEEMLVRVLAGHASATAHGVTRWLVAGQELTVPLGGPDGLSAAGAPGEPVPARREPALNGLGGLLAAVDGEPSTGPVTISGPIEVINPAVPSFTVLGWEIDLSGVAGWETLMPGAWVVVEGDGTGFGLAARAIRPAPAPLVVRATEVPAAPAMPAPPIAAPPAEVAPPPADSGPAAPGAIPTATPTATESPAPPVPPTPTEPSTPTPTLSPTLTPTLTPTDGPLERLRLTGLCSPDPDAYRVWRVRNANMFDVLFTWELVGSGSGQNGEAVAPAFGEVIFTTVTEHGPNTVRIRVNGELHDTKGSNPERCP